jgi:hypothetical protein
MFPEALALLEKRQDDLRYVHNMTSIAASRGI